MVRHEHGLDLAWIDSRRWVSGWTAFNVLRCEMVPRPTMRTTTRRSFVTMAIALVALVGCSATIPPTRTVTGVGNEQQLPAALDMLELDAVQRPQVVALMAKSRTTIEPLVDAGREMLRSVAGAVRRCKGTSPFVEMDASSAIAEGDHLRGRLLDAINQLHAILTPAQRKALANHLLEAKARDPQRDEDRARSLGDELDLSVGQMVTALLAMRQLERQLKPELKRWRKRYRDALKAFARDDFNARKQAIAELPAIALATRTMRHALRMLVPMLKPQQCAAAARWLSNKLKDGTDKVD